MNGFEHAVNFTKRLGRIKHVIIEAAVYNLNTRLKVIDLPLISKDDYNKLEKLASQKTTLLQEFLKNFGKK